MMGMEEWFFFAFFGVEQVWNHQFLRTVRVTYVPSGSSTNLVIYWSWLLQFDSHTGSQTHFLQLAERHHDKSHAKAPTSYFQHLLVIKPKSCFQPYCWWKRSRTSWYGKYPIIYIQVLYKGYIYIPGGCLGVLNHHQYLPELRLLGLFGHDLYGWSLGQKGRSRGNAEMLLGGNAVIYCRFGAYSPEN